MSEKETRKVLNLSFLLQYEILFAPGEKHWHGATPSTAMTHIAIQENLDGKVVE
ncbi:MAG TPA: hypothetical protein VIJ95_05780 [Hanamia sp.]